MLKYFGGASAVASFVGSSPNTGRCPDRAMSRGHQMHVLRKPRTALRIAQYPVASTRLDAGRRPPGQDSALTSADKVDTPLRKAREAVNKKKRRNGRLPSR